MLVHRDDGGGVAHEAVGQLRHVHQAILLDTDIDEAAEVGDIGDDAGKHHACLDIVDGAQALIEAPHLDGLAGVATGLLQLGHDIVQRGVAHSVAHIAADIDLRT